MSMNKRKICFLFPGQGAQKVGMLGDFFEEFVCFKGIFDDVRKWTGIDVGKIVYEPNDLINQTKWTQLSVLTVELGLLRVLRDVGIRPFVMAGYSLGEYACLVQSGVLTEEAAIRLIVRRAECMESACPAGTGGMAAVIGKTWDEVKKILAPYDKVWIANYNTKSLVSISGERKQVEMASEDLKDAGAKRVIPVNVSGPFHTPLLNKASEEFASLLDDFDFSGPETGYYANCTGGLVRKGDDVKSLLSKQISSPVKWSHLISKIIFSGVRTFVEVGPGKVLRGFLRDEKGLELFGLESKSEYEVLCNEIG